MTTTNSISGIDNHGNQITLRIGDRVRFDTNSNIGIREDVVRACFVDTVLLEPYGRNYDQPAVVLTEHSWTPLSRIIEVL